MKVGDIVKFESMYISPPSFGVVVDLRGRLIIVKWFDDGEVQTYSAKDLIKVSDDDI
jgi:hypothetical protein